MRGQRHSHRDLKRPEFAFSETYARKQLSSSSCLECWATQFRCPCCGPCTNGMVTTKKTCLLCDEGLVRLVVDDPLCQYHKVKPPVRS